MANNFRVAIYLPQEILTTIFLKLGVKSLLRCKSVCKTWLSVISNSHFVKSHVNIAIMNPTLLIIDYPEGYAASLARRGTSVSYFPRVSLPSVCKECDVVGSSCNGIICLCYHDAVFYLWNPSIEGFKRLPRAPPRELDGCHKIGFGYDSVSDCYKIVRIVYEHLDDEFPTVHLYSTEADSWRRFQDPVLKYVGGCESNDVVVNGVLYFGHGHELITFDLHTEVFGLVMLPGFLKTEKSNVLDFKDSVAMAFESDGEEQGIFLWALDDVSGQMQWTKKFRITVLQVERNNAYSDSRLWLFCYLGAGKFYGRMEYKDYFLHNILYDYETEETNICGVRENVCATMKYTQTLVSLDGFGNSQLNHGINNLVVAIQSFLQDHALTRS